jgi:hypothetical protein
MYPMLNNALSFEFLHRSFRVSFVKDDYPLPKHLKRIRRRRDDKGDVFSVLLCNLATLQAIATRNGENLTIDDDGATMPAALGVFGVPRLTTAFVPKYAPLSRAQYERWSQLWPILPSLFSAYVVRVAHTFEPTTAVFLFRSYQQSVWFFSIV